MTPPSSSSGQRATLQVRTLSNDAQTPEEIEAEIEVQREQLAETIDALSAKLDVKAQAQAKVEEAKQTAQEKVAHVKQTVTHSAHTAQSSVGSAAGRVHRPEVVAFAVTVVVATVVLWWRER
jgi:preprotein translocase subunit SecF